MEASKDIKIRREESADERITEEIIREAFWNVYKPGWDEQYLAHNLRRSPDFIAPLNLVAAVNRQIVGSIMYTKSKIEVESGDIVPTITMVAYSNITSR